MQSARPVLFKGHAATKKNIALLPYKPRSYFPCTQKHYCTIAVQTSELLSMYTKCSIALLPYKPRSYFPCTQNAALHYCRTNLGVTFHVHKMQHAWHNTYWELFSISTHPCCFLGRRESARPAHSPAVHFHPSPLPPRRLLHRLGNQLQTAMDQCAPFSHSLWKHTIATKIAFFLKLVKLLWYYTLCANSHSHLRTEVHL